MTGLTAKRLLSITLAAASLAMLAAAEPAAASTLRVSAGSAQRAANEVEADYTTSHVLISETARESVPITIFFDPQVTGVEVGRSVHQPRSPRLGDGRPQWQWRRRRDQSALRQQHRRRRRSPLLQGLSNEPGSRRVPAHLADIENRCVPSHSALPADLGSAGRIPLVRQRAERARDPETRSRHRRLAGKSKRPPALRSQSADDRRHWNGAGPAGILCQNDEPRPRRRRTALQPRLFEATRCQCPLAAAHSSARDRRAPDRSGHQSAVRARQPVCGQELLRGDAVDGLGFHPGLVARRKRHAARTRCGPCRVPELRQGGERAAASPSFSTCRSITRPTTRNSPRRANIIGGTPAPPTPPRSGQSKRESSRGPVNMTSAQAAPVTLLPRRTATILANGRMFQISISAATPPSSPIRRSKKTIKTRVTGSTTVWGPKTATARAMVISTRSHSGFGSSSATICSSG